MGESPFCSNLYCNTVACARPDQLFCGAWQEVLGLVPPTPPRFQPTAAPPERIEEAKPASFHTSERSELSWRGAEDRYALPAPDSMRTCAGPLDSAQRAAREAEATEVTWPPPSFDTGGFTAVPEESAPTSPTAVPEESASTSPTREASPAPPEGQVGCVEMPECRASSGRTAPSEAGGGVSVRSTSDLWLLAANVAHGVGEAAEDGPEVAVDKPVRDLPASPPCGAASDSVSIDDCFTRRRQVRLQPIREPDVAG